ncbi:hypothetical protein [Pseudomonas fluorescens]|uniref:hypothetical protein n=1 Tax=Pseudomonas fluorescens TaxID=294 RepID=UPI003D19EA50
MTEPLDLTSKYTNNEYKYRMGGDGFVEENGKKLIDCSHMLNLLLTGAGYNVPYEDTSVLNNSQYYTTVEPQDVKRGDIALWINASPTKGTGTLNHTGIVEAYDNSKLLENGTIFGAQTTKGPSSAVFGVPKKSYYWPLPTKFLRVKEEFRAGAATTPASAPAPATQQVPVKNSIIEFQYPIRKPDGKPFSNADELYSAIENETAGQYLLGSHDFWHGGIHISDLSASYCVKNEPVRCMADGVVVAYRLNEDYLSSDYSGTTPAKLKYSNSFCLVRHDYKSPVNLEEGPNKGKRNTLTFFSLYMHLMPYKCYALSTEEVGNPKIKMVIGDYIARSELEDGPQCEKYGVISAGAVFEVLEETMAANGLVYARGKLLSGKVAKRKVGQEAWFAFKKDDAPVRNKKDKAIWEAILPPERTSPGYWHGQVKARVEAPNGLPLFNKPSVLASGESAGAPIADMALCATSEIQFDSAKVFNLKVGASLLRMAECTLLSGGLRAGGVTPTTFWACVEDVGRNRTVTWQKIVPAEFDSIVSGETAIKAGDPIGYLGLQENLGKTDGEVVKKHHVHIEIFTSDAGLDKFLQNEAGLKVGMNYLSLPANTALLKKTSDSESATLETNHILNVGTVPIFKDPQGVEWYEPTVTEKGKKLTGLIKKSDVSFTSSGPQLLSQHDWAKLGYTIVREENSNADGFLDPESMPPFFKELHAQLDALGDGDGEVTVADLSSALKNTEFRDKWTKLIAYHPTEWQAKSSDPKWSRLNSLLVDSPKILEHEQARIDKLVFWDELSGALQVSLPKQIYHFHPIAFINNFMKFSVPGRGWAHSAFANLLANVESNNDYTAYNKTKGGLQSFYKTNLTTLTIAELQQKQKDRAIFAAGRYQMVPDTINAAVKKLELDSSLKFDEGVQDRIFEEYLIKVKRKAFIQYLEGDGDIERAIYAWALEFASAGVRKGKTISPIAKRDENNKIVMEADGETPVMLSRVASFEGQSYYAGDGLNTAHILPVDMVRVLEESKQNGK